MSAFKAYINDGLTWCLCAARCGFQALNSVANKKNGVFDTLLKSMRMQIVKIGETGAAN